MGSANGLLGVMVPERYRAVASAIFELFKTCWEPVREDTEYEAILSHSETPGREGRRLTIVTGGVGPLDRMWGVPSAPQAPPTRIEAVGIGIDLHHPWLPLGPKAEASAWSAPGRLRLGYDLFAEIETLFTTGQGGAAALRANAERHVEVLRVAMLTAGLPVVEVEAAPGGKSFAVAVTHDVDFVRLRNHFLDRTAAGFLYRATLGTIAEFLRGRAGLQKLRRNLAAALELPLVYLGRARDPWNCFAAYAALEQRWGSTFYVVPRRDHPGTSAPHGEVDPSRACRYQASEMAADLTALEKAGFEVGLHGLDAWTGVAEARAERSEIQKASGGRVSGIRMHWLYFSQESYAAIESAGFDYDSTYGLDDSIGFRAGTGQAFRPLGAEHLLELPLVIQDTALFLARRMNLDERQAFAICEGVIAEAHAFGGGITLLWHMRSLAPERCWDSFYTQLLEHLEAEGAWLASASDVVEFYRRRRSVQLDVRIRDNALTIRARTEDEFDKRLWLRVRFPDGAQPLLRLPLDREAFQFPLTP